jgi:hypothetical protein
MSAYQYEIVYRSSSDNANADLLSRLPVDAASTADGDENFLCYTVVDSLPVTAVKIAQESSRDEMLSKAIDWSLSGWPSTCPDSKFQALWSHREELSLEDDCLMWGRRVIIPSSLQVKLLTNLHDGHPGVCRMKALARSFVWWPGLDADIEEMCRVCVECSNERAVPKAVPLLLWPWATEVWQRIHIDYLELRGQMFLLLVDSYSKWLEVIPMSSTTSAATIGVLRSLFSRFGLPIQLVSDNGPQFSSEEFALFLKNNGIKHTLCPPYHPASNGLAERYVQTFKSMMKKADPSLALSHKVSHVLFLYRNVPNTTTGKCPSELFLKRSPRSILTMVKPCLNRKVEERQERSKFYRDGRHPVPRKFDLYQNVRVRNVRGGVQKWISGVVVQIKGPSTYLVRVPGNSRRFVHADHLIADEVGSSSGNFDGFPVENTNGPLVTNPTFDSEANPTPNFPLGTNTNSTLNSDVNQTPTSPHVTNSAFDSEGPVTPESGPAGIKTPDPIRRSGRCINPPVRYGH